MSKKYLVLPVLALIFLVSLQQAHAMSVSFGTSGSDLVKQIQQKLIDTGYLEGTATGNYLNLTKNAVLKFQKEKNIVGGDGTVVGPKTLSALNLNSNANREQVSISGEVKGAVSGIDGFSRTLRGVDGSLDNSFDPGTGANDIVYATDVQSDGKVLLGGYFVSYNGTPRKFIARANSDGSLDATFDPGASFNNVVFAIATQSDGKVLVGGNFTSYGTTARRFIARLNTDGSLDTTFNPGTGANTSVFSILPQPDGKIIIVGNFTSYNGISRNRIARLNTDGSLDTTFNPGTGANSSIYAAKVQPNGKIVIGGNFTSYNGMPRTRIARLNTDGSLDTTFDPGLGAGSNYIATMAIQFDGKIVIGGFFNSYAGVPRNYIARLNTDGSLDTTFDPGLGADLWVMSLGTQPDGKIIAGGYFTSYNGTPVSHIARLNTDGSLDTTFNPGAAGANDMVYALRIQNDGKVVIGGYLTYYNNVFRNHIARINGYTPSTACTINSFTVPSSTTISSGLSVTASWTSSNCTNVILEVNSGSYTQRYAAGPNGSYTFAASTGVVYSNTDSAVDVTLIAGNSAETVSTTSSVAVADVSSPASNQCQISSLTATPNPASGGQTTLSWQAPAGCIVYVESWTPGTNGLTSAHIFKPGTYYFNASDSVSIKVNSASTYYVSAQAGAGGAMVLSAKTVDVKLQ